MSLFLNVPPTEKELASAKGARWSHEDQSWYLPADDFDRLIDIDAWIPQQNPCIILPDPVILIKSTSPCWKCHHSNTFIAFAANFFYEKDNNERDELVWRLQDFFAIFEQIIEISDNLQSLLNKEYPLYKYVWSDVADRHLWLNHCEICHSKQEDSYLFNKQNGLFHPKTREEAAKLQLQSFNLKYNAIIDADYEMNEHARLINEFAIRPG
ncbi:hypothetical protein DVR12_15685 [Chitinophaga silvatica]|uniref:DUF5710 domain-containing protein n=1 Tax=Chitinophaga silvatica TaxID=2282649 RepID=A0A3E1Y805_9BACT|nr:DUF5710 domain-containing protein [Chitinophaga silvatica]RFS21342.1 hypothetical protein DVR12_15685 [Chitinophaga silvatica]